MIVQSLYENTYTVGVDRVFIPFDKNKDDLYSCPKGSIIIDIQPFLVVTKNDKILLDTGLGNTYNNNMHIHTILKKNMVNPNDITKVFISHLHKDHSGGIFNSIMPSELSFPYATYYIQKKEYEWVMSTQGGNYPRNLLIQLAHHRQINWIDGYGTIDNILTYEISGGHTPFHQVCWIKEDEKTIFYGADELAGAQQLKYQYLAKYDYNPRVAYNNRIKWKTTGEKENWKFLFYHDQQASSVY
ncbi:MAG: MBL fold metallo-hydrolase [Phycisphaerales bacterium]|nr:MBL fold metallo-hydrolase [Phycisphaerales bacterium]